MLLCDKESRTNVDVICVEASKMLNVEARKFKIDLEIFYEKLLSECRGLCHTKVCLILNLPDFLIQICDRLKLKTDSCR